jgi:hypothetical protein
MAVGHEMGQCGIRARLARLRRERCIKEDQGHGSILDARLGEWICNSNQMPRDSGVQVRRWTTSSGLASQ